MEITNNNRFTVKKNAYEYLKSLDPQDPISKKIEKIKLCKPSDYEYKYIGDTDFKSFFSGNFDKTEEIVKYYPDVELFLKNIYWDGIFANAEKIIEQIVQNIGKQKDKSLFIVSVNPLEMVVVGEILKNAGLNNLSYSLIRQPLINSYAKTFEALLLMVSFEKSEYFQDLAKPIIEKTKNTLKSAKKEDCYVIIDENNQTHKFNYHGISAYLKAQIGMNEDKTTYRIDKYPQKAFIESKGIKSIIVMDSDNDVGKSIEYYLNSLKTELPSVKTEKIVYSNNETKDIGYYEDYLFDQNIQYNLYKANIERVTANKAQINVKAAKTGTSKADPYVYRKKVTEYSELGKRIVPFLVIFPILIIAFLVSDLGGGSYSGNRTTTGGSTYRSSTYIFGSFGGNGSSSVGSSSSSSSSSMIKSFGGGGFSKGFS